MEWIHALKQAIGTTGSQIESPLVATLATVDAQRLPAARSVIIRRVLDDGTLWFTSHSLSQKNSELRQHSRAALCFWFPQTREQFRVNGEVKILTEETDPISVREMWGTLSESTRATFYWPAPDTPLKKQADAFPAAPPAGKPQPAETFEVLVLTPHVVDHLDLRTHPHTRRQWGEDRDSKKWWVEMLNP